MIDMLADPVRAQDETAGTEGALMQTLDRLRVVGGFGQDGQREIIHDREIASSGASSIVRGMPMRPQSSPIDGA